MRRTTIEGDSCGELKGITRTFFSSPCENRSMRLSNPLVRSLRRSGTILKTACSSGRHLVEADRTDSQSYCPIEDGRYPLPGYPHLGHPLLSVIPGLLGSFEPPKTALALHTRRF